MKLEKYLKTINRIYRRFLSALLSVPVPAITQENEICNKALIGRFDDIDCNKNHVLVKDSYAVPYVSGWYMLEVNIDGKFSRYPITIYFIKNTPVEQSHKLTLQIVNGVLIKKLTYIEFDSDHIIVDLPPNIDLSNIKRLRLAPVTKRFAIDRMLRRIKKHTYIFDGKINNEIIGHIEDEANYSNKETRKVIYNYYEATFGCHSSSVSYSDWIANNESKTNKEDVVLHRNVEEFSFKPLISVVLPVYNPEPFLLNKAIESVQKQIYSKWELCIIDDASTDLKIKKILEDVSENDKRIRLKFRSENGHISRASNDALRMAKGDYVALFDQDDELSKYALFEVVKVINNNSGVMVIYSDEDKIDAEGKRFDPHFKSDWNPDLLLSQNYISHLGVYCRDLLKTINGFREGVEGSQDYDLLLRCLPHINDDEIIHIPKVLYHWRATDGSTALSPNNKDYTTKAGIKSLNDYFYSIDQKARVDKGMNPNTYRVIYPIPDDKPMVSLIIPTRDKLNLLKSCVESIIHKTSYDNYEVIILDNQSREPETLDWLNNIKSNYERVRVLHYDKVFNYSAINNYGVAYANGEIIGLINNDIEVVNEEWLTEMVSHACRPDIGCVGAKLYYSNDQIQHGGVILGIGGVAGHAHKYFGRYEHGYFSRLKLVQNVSAVTGACLLVRKSIYEQVGGLDEDNLKIAFNDVDFCLKVREAGYRNLWTPYAELYHHESVSRGAEDTAKKQRRFQKEIGYMKERWGDELLNDPYYNPNLTLTREDFSLRSVI